MNDQTPQHPQPYDSHQGSVPQSQPAPQGSTGWRSLSRRTRIGAAVAGVMLCGFGFLGGIVVGGASADDTGQSGPGMGGQGGPGMGGPGSGGPGMGGSGNGQLPGQAPGGSQDDTGQGVRSAPDGAGG